MNIEISVRNILIVFIFCISFTNLYSQNNQVLDDKKGFKRFVIGDNKSKYEGQLKYYKTTTDGNTTGYILTSNNDDDLMVFKNRFDRILLFFDKQDKLETLNLVKDYNGDSFNTAMTELKELMSNLMFIFGAPTEKLGDDNSSLAGYGWVGKKIMLTCTNTYLSAKDGSQTEVMVSDYAKEIKAGF